jgi:hypothetical protein
MIRYNIANTKSDYKKDINYIGWETKKGDIYLLCPFHKEKLHHV